MSTGSCCVRPMSRRRSPPNKSSLVTIRRIFVGNRAELEVVNQAISAHERRPVIDRVFEFAETHDAFRYYLSGDAFGKVIIRID
jgi:NADPH:quinone reductase-like Zn-dependent oxidoreductase